MKIKIGRDEWWPVYDIDLPSSDDDGVEVSEQFYKKCKSADLDFQVVQEELRKLYNRQKEDKKS